MARQRSKNLTLLEKLKRLQARKEQQLAKAKRIMAYYQKMSEKKGRLITDIDLSLKGLKRAELRVADSQKLIVQFLEGLTTRALVKKAAKALQKSVQGYLNGQGFSDVAEAYALSDLKMDTQSAGLTRTQLGYIRVTPVAPKMPTTRKGSNLGSKVQQSLETKVYVAEGNTFIVNLQRGVNCKVGDTLDQCLNVLGKTRKKLKVGNRQSLIYPGMRLVFENNTLQEIVT
jgi:hypothetical protein